MPIQPSRKLIQQINNNQNDDETLILEGECSEGDHRLTLRIPRWLLVKIDAKRKKRIGSISRNLLILECIEEAMN